MFNSALLVTQAWEETAEAGLLGARTTRRVSTPSNSFLIIFTGCVFLLGQRGGSRLPYLASCRMFLAALAAGYHQSDRFLPGCWKNAGYFSPWFIKAQRTPKASLTLTLEISWDKPLCLKQKKKTGNGLEDPEQASSAG